MSEPVVVAKPIAGRVLFLDYLRLFAALSVMFFHYFHEGIRTGKIANLGTYTVVEPVARYGYLGVHLFFLISGFVIFNSARGKSARQFVVGRVVRLLPAYWSAMLVTAAAVGVAGSSAGLTVSWTQVVFNLTMVPSLFGVEPVDGVYWTLLLEVQFYILVFLFVLAGRRDTLSALLPWWTLGMLVLNLAAPAYDSVFPYLGGYFALFAAGALIAEIHHCGLTLLRGVGLLASAIVAVRFSTRLAAYVTRTEGVEYSPGILTVVLLSFFSVILLLGSDRLQHLRLPWAMTAGALTYPLYLLHANLGYLMLSQVASVESRWYGYAMVVTVMIGLSLLLHVIVEKRLRDTWWRVFDATAGRAVGALESWIRSRSDESHSRLGQRSGS